MINTISGVRHAATQSMSDVITKRVLNVSRFAADHTGEINFVAPEEVQIVKTLKNTLVLTPQKMLLDSVTTANLKRIPQDELERQARALRATIIQDELPFASFDALRRLMRKVVIEAPIEHDLLILRELLRLAKEDTLLTRLGYTEDLLYHFIDTYRRPLQAAINIEEATKQFASEEQPEHKLKASYERIVGNTTSVLSALREWIGDNPEKMQAQRAFLQTAVIADLERIEMGVDKVHLLVLLTELKSMRIYTLLHESLEKLRNKRLKKSVDNMLGTTLEYIEEPLRTFPSIEKWVNCAIMDEQILFFQDYRNVFSSIPQDAYKDSTQKDSCKGILQNRIDELVYSE